MEELKTKSLVLKVWHEKLTSHSVGLRGEIRDPNERKTSYFSDWSELKAILEATIDTKNNVDKLFK